MGGGVEYVTITQYYLKGIRNTFFPYGSIWNNGIVLGHSAPHIKAINKIKPEK